MESQRFDKPREYLEFARQLIGLVRDGTYVLTQSTCTLEDLFNPEWPAEPSRATNAPFGCLETRCSHQA